MARPNPLLLIWAREEAGLSLPAAAAKIGISSERLEEWEANRSLPTFPQLRTLARVYHRALAVFFLSEVPKKFRVGTDFRRAPGDVAERYSPELRLDIREVELHRDIAYALAESSGNPPTTFDFRADANEQPEDVGVRLREFLAPDLGRSVDARVAFNTWRASLEKQGALVFQTARASLAEMRGFSIAQDTFPVIAVNRRDALYGRVFTMLHEATHIALRHGGVCDLHEDGPSTEQLRLETFCNFSAGAALIPRELLIRDPLVRAHGRSPEWDDGTIAAIARRFGSSREVVVRRLLITKLTTVDFYEAARARYIREFEEQLESQSGASREMKRNVPVETVGLLGAPYVSLVLSTLAEDRITLSDVSSYLNVRIKHIGKIAALLADR